jgi:hypothetical protein
MRQLAAPFTELGCREVRTLAADGLARRLPELVASAVAERSRRR